MEAYVTTPDPNSYSDPLTRLLAAILAFLRALLAEHQAAQLPPALVRRVFIGKTAKNSTKRHRTAAIARARTSAPACEVPSAYPRALCLRDATAGLLRPRLVAPS